MYDLLRIQKPVYQYLPVFFFGISKTVLGRYRYSLGVIHPMKTQNNDIQKFILFTEMIKIPYFSYEKVKLATYPLWINAE